MAQPWSAVESSPQYQSLAPDQQVAAKQQYFSSVVSQKPEYQAMEPADQQLAQKQFLGSAQPDNSQDNQTPSVASEGFNYFKDHPFKAIFEGATKTLTGNSLQDNALNATKPKDQPMNPQQIADYKSKWGTAPSAIDQNLMQPGHDVENAVVTAKNAAAGMAGSAADMATTPGNYIPIPIAEVAGKIPVGSTNLGRIATNVAVDKTFPQGVKDLQAMENKLGNIDTSASGKAINTSSRGVSSANISPVANQSVLNAYNTIVQPSTGKFTSPQKLNSYNKNAVLAMKTINDWKDETGVDLTSKTGGIVPTATRSDLLDAVQSTKKAIWDNVDSSAKDASLAGAQVDMSKVAKDVLQPLIDNSSIIRQRPEILPFLNSTMKTYSDAGTISVKEAQDDLKILNEDIGKYMRSTNPDQVSQGAVKLAISQAMRSQMDGAIEEHLGNSGYQDLRNQYGALSSVENDITKAAARQAKGSTGVSHPILDVMSGVDIGKALLSVVTGSPVQAAKEAGLAGIMQGVKGSIDWMKSPDAKIAGMFEDINKNIGRTSPNIRNTDYSNPAIKTMSNYKDSSNPRLIPQDKTKLLPPPQPNPRHGTYLKDRQDNIPSILEGKQPLRPEAMVNNTNPNANIGPYTDVHPNAMDALIKAHREMDLGNVQQKDVQNAIDMANHFNENNIGVTGLNVKKFSDLKAFNKFVSNNQSKVDFISTDSDDNFYAHLKQGKTK